MITQTIETPSYRCFLNITEQIRSAVRKSGVVDGICVVYVPHTTCGITINESADPDVRKDLLFALERMVPNNGFHHSEGNSDAHMQSALLGFSQTFIVQNSQLVLGRWQAIYLAEFDGPRTRNLHIQCISA